MKKFTLTIASLCIFVHLSAQSVMSIPFGSSYEHVKECLENRIGEYNVHEEGGNLWTTDISLGDYKFNYGNFDFQHGNYKSYFSHASFSAYFSLENKNTAIKFRDSLKDLLYKKYGEEYYEEYSNDDGFKCFKFGQNPKDSAKVLILLTLRKSKSKGGQMFYYVDIDYGPIYYIDEDADF